MFTSNKLTLTASDSGLEAIESSGTLVGFDSDSCHANSSPGERAMKERLICSLVLTSRVLKFERNTRERETHTPYSINRLS